MKRLLLIFFAIFILVSPAQGEFFKDIIVTSPTGIWTDSRAYTTLNAAVTAIGASEQDLYIAKEEVVTTLVIPANIRLHFLRDGAIANSNTLTINTKNIHADHQIFTGVGAVNFTPGTEVQSVWFEDFETAITQTSNDTVTLLINSSDTLSNSVAVGDNIILKWDSYNPITIAAGQTLSNVGDISAPDIHLFVVSGAIAFKTPSPLKAVYASWFGNSLATLDIADNAAVVAGKTLIISSGPWVIDANLTLSSYVKMLPGADLQIATNITCAFTGQLDIGNYQVFTLTGTGKATFPTGALVKSAWFSSLADAITCLGTTSTQLEITKSETISTDTTIVSTTKVTVQPGNILSVDTGKTLTINGPLDAGLYQIFSCTGTGKVVLGTSVKTLYPNWWGTNQAALQACLTSSSGKEIQITGTWTIATAGMAVSGLSNTSIIGTNAVIDATATAGIRTLSLTSCSDILIEGVSFLGPDGPSLETTTAQTPWTAGGFTGNEAAIYATLCSNIVVSRCKFLEYSDVAILGYKVTKLTVNNNQIIGHFVPSMSTGVNTHWYCVGMWLRNGQLIARDNNLSLVTYGFVTENETVAGYPTSDHIIDGNRVEFTDFATCGIYTNSAYNSRYTNNTFIVPSTGLCKDGTIKLSGDSYNCLVQGNSINNGYLLIENAHDSNIIDNNIYGLLNSDGTNTTSWPGIYIDGTAPHNINIIGNRVSAISLGYGISVVAGALDINISNNFIWSCALGGIKFAPTTTLIDRVNISGNSLISNGVYQLAIYGGAGLFGKFNIVNNIILKGGGAATHGIYIAPAGACATLVVLIDGNQVKDHTTLDYYVADADACNNVITSDLPQAAVDASGIRTGLRETNFTIAGAGPVAYTLADGYREGQRKILRGVSFAGGGTAVITPTTATFTSTTLSVAGHCTELVWTNGAWSVVSNYGATVAP